MKKSLVLLTCTLIITSLFIPLAKADGGTYKRLDPDMREFGLSDQKEQMGVISHENGKQKMVIGVSPEQATGESFWILPIPSEPEKSKVDISKSFPTVQEGSTVEMKVGERINNIFFLGSIYHFATAPGVHLVGGIFGTIGGVAGKPGRVEVHQHVEEAGLTTELITAKEASDLNNYLDKKQVNLPDESMQEIQEYIGKDYSFAVTWVSNSSKLEQAGYEAPDYPHHPGTPKLSLYTEFPTEKIYYPLKLTSVYGEEEIPITIYVMGFYEPELYPEIKKDTRTNHYVGASLEGGEDLIEEKDHYTKVKINTKSSNFKKDLRMHKTSKPKIALGISQGWLIIIMLIMIFSSYLTSKIYFRKLNRKNRVFMSFLGITNLFSIIAYYIFLSNLEHAAERKEEEGELENKELLKLSEGKGSFKIRLIFTYLVISISLLFTVSFILQDLLALMI